MNYVGTTPIGLATTKATILMQRMHMPQRQHIKQLMMRYRRLEEEPFPLSVLLEVLVRLED